MAFCSVSLLVLLVALVLQQGSSSKHHRVAFVFAGSGRSFKNPFVHESIRVNLIHSFCPPRMCDSVIFARISLSDNKHQNDSGDAVRDAKGISIAADPTEKPRITAALDRLARFPEASMSSSLDNTNRPSSSPVVVTWADVGTAEEKAEIQRDFPGPRHKIFSQLDARRYSMYFNRHKSYLQVGAYEAQHGVNFTWVVHVRLDSFWGEPMQPVSFWASMDSSTNHKYGKFSPTPPFSLRTHHHHHAQLPQESMKIWVTDTWWCEVPDTFALLPRHYSDKFFDLDSLVAPGVMCLGGPNFDMDTTKAESLQANGFTESEQELVQKLICRREEDGHSEFILKRKLQHFGIDLDKGNLGYTTMFFAIVRPNLEDMCFYLEDRRMIGWIFDKQYGNRAHRVACYHIMSFVRHYSDDKGKVGMITDRTAYIDANGDPIALRNTVRENPRHSALVGVVPITSTSPITGAGAATYSLTTTAMDTSNNANTNITTVPKPAHSLLVSSNPMEAFLSACTLDPVTKEYVGFNCLLDAHQTDWNFMPFRLHKHNKCLSFDDSGADRTLSLWNNSCINGVSVGHMNTTYSLSQMFHFFPMVKSTQQIQVYQDKQEAFACLTSVELPNSGSGSGDGLSHLTARRALVAERCVVEANTYQKAFWLRKGVNESVPTSPAALSQQFLIKVRRDATAGENKETFIVGKSASAPHANRYASPHSLLPSVITVSIAQITRFEDTALLANWYGHSRNHHGHSGGRSSSTADHASSLMCLALYAPKIPTTTTDGGSSGAGSLEDQLKAHEVAMEPCDAKAPQQMIVIERTTTAAWMKFIRQGIERAHYQQQPAPKQAG